MKEKYKILIIVDENDNRNSYSNILKNLPEFHVLTIKKDQVTFKKIIKILPDIIICVLDNYEIFEQELHNLLKSDPQAGLTNIYLIIVGDQNNKALEHNLADEYLAKSVDPEELLFNVKVGLKIISRLKKTQIEAENMFKEMDVLLIQEGGCAPGYNPVTAFITYHLESQGRRVYATLEGFRSLVSGNTTDFLRLVYNPDLFKKLDYIPGVYHVAPLSESRGARLRGERYRDFLKIEFQKKAAANIKKRKVKVIIAIGGNGTFKGIQSLCEMLPTSIQVFFLPVTIDSDIAGTECIGQHTGIEMGAEKIRCFMADARTHKRTYIVEMMGAQSGFHALHSCLGSRAHLAVLPNSVIDHKKVAEAINRRGECVIVVAEGYKKEERDAKKLGDNAAEYFYRELLGTGAKINRRVVCEPFSRDIRGAAPKNQDISLCQRMAYNVTAYIKAGTSRLMPAVLAGKEHAIPFNEIRTDNRVEENLLVLANRLTRD